MNRVISTTACVLAAALALAASLTAVPDAQGAEPALTLEQANAIVLEKGAALFDGPDAPAKRVGQLAPWSRISLESRGLTEFQLDEYSCTVRWSLMTSQGRRWVNGAALAVRQSVPTMRSEYPTLDSRPLAKDDSAVPATAWFGYQRSSEWSEKFGCDTSIESGWLFTSGNGVLHSAQLTYSSGWGTSEHLEQFAWIDLDGDGQAELVSDWSTSITEAGYGGREVRVLGTDLRTKLEVHVGDPRMMGLGQSSWGRLQLESARLIHDSISEVECPVGAPSSPTPDPSPTWGSTICFSTERITWNKLVASTAPFAATANGKPIVGWYHPEGPSASGKAPVQVLVKDGQSYEWHTEPTVFPSWLSGVFAGDPTRAKWVELN